ncbi:MAG TPA: cytosine permease, partial [Chitinophagaceae bacterium]|nr:cytosine permease [Chitinophagaceae bacterium]
SHSGKYFYKNGFNAKAIIALLAGVLPNVPGFLVIVKVLHSNSVPAWIADLYNYAWFVGFFVSGFVYWLLMKRR